MKRKAFLATCLSLIPGVVVAKNLFDEKLPDGKNGMIIKHHKYIFDSRVFVGLSNDKGIEPSLVSGEFGYQRISAEFGTASFGGITNSTEIIFPEVVKKDWGKITRWVVYDSIILGKLLAYGEFTIPKSLHVGNIAHILIGDLEIKT